MWTRPISTTEARHVRPRPNRVTRDATSRCKTRLRSHHSIIRERNSLFQNLAQSIYRQHRQRVRPSAYPCHPLRGASALDSIPGSPRSTSPFVTSRPHQPFSARRCATQQQSHRHGGLCGYVPPSPTTSHPSARTRHTLTSQIESLSTRSTPLRRSPRQARPARRPPSDSASMASTSRPWRATSTASWSGPRRRLASARRRCSGRRISGMRGTRSGASRGRMRRGGISRR